MVKEEEKTIFNFLMFPVPSSIVRNLRIDEEIEPERAENIMTSPPTTLYMPKSLAPKALRTTRLVYKFMMRVQSILTYRNSVFFAIRLLFSAVFVIISIYKTKPIDLYSYFTLI